MATPPPHLPLSCPRPLGTPSRLSQGSMFAPPITPVILDSEDESEPELVPDGSSATTTTSTSTSTSTGTNANANVNSKDTVQTTVLPIRSPLPVFKTPACAEPLLDGANEGECDCGRFLVNRVALAESPGRGNLTVSRGCAGERAASAVKGGEDGCACSSSSSKATDPVDTNKAAASRADGEGNKLKRPRTTKAKTKEGATGANKSIRGKVGKAGAGKGQQPSKSVREEKSTITGAEEGVADDFEDLQLRAATKRRSVWTPTKDNSALDAIDLTQSPPAGNNVKFGDLISGYGYGTGQDISGHRSVASGSGDMPATKKRRVQLLQTSSGSLTSESPNDEDTSTTKTSTRGKNPPKKKKPKARPVTITSLTTAPYETETTPPEHSVLEHPLPTQTENPAPEKKTRKPRTTKSGKQTKSRSKKVKTPPPSFKVVPALDALKSLDDQTLVFGTCSQLEQDATPELDSAQARETSTIQSFSSSGCSGSSSRLGVSSRISKLAGSRSLWAAASRDLNDSLTDIEVVDLQDPDAVVPSPKIDKMADVDSRTGASEPAASEPSTSVVRDDIEEDCGSSSTKQSDPPPETTSNAAAASSMPHYRGFSTSELASQIAAYGFKPIKNRETAISLLEKCWESRNGTSNTSNNNHNHNSSGSNEAAQSRPSSSSHNAYTSSGVSATVKESTKGKSPAKTKSRTSRTKSTLDGSREANIPEATSSYSSKASQESGFYEIADSSDEEDNPQSPYRAISYEDIGHSYLEGELEHDSFSATVNQQNTGPSEQNSWDDDNREFYRVITEAVKAQPRMRAVHGIKQPTWYEKILMYDPICVDSLTVWLNTDGLGRVGEEDEVDAWTVRDWCESRGVCCTWKKVGWGK